MDCYTFCDVLGGEEANRQLRAHWDTWYALLIYLEHRWRKRENSIRILLFLLTTELLGSLLHTFIWTCN